MSPDHARLRSSRLRFCCLSWWTLIVHLSRAAHLEGAPTTTRIRPDLCCWHDVAGPRHASSVLSSSRTTLSSSFLDPVRTPRLLEQQRCRRRRSGRLSLLADHHEDHLSRTTTRSTPVARRSTTSTIGSRNAQGYMSRRRSVLDASGSKSIQGPLSMMLPSCSGSRHRRSSARRYSHPADHVDETASSSTEQSTTAVQCHTLQGVERVYCLSDLHTDHSANLEWLQRRMKRPRPPRNPAAASESSSSWSSKDLLVIAGDISHSLSLLETTLECLLEPGCRVLFVAGNHEAWRDHHPVDGARSRDNNSTTFGSKGRSAGSPRQQSTSSSWSSLDKIERVYETCRRLGVIVDPCFVPSLAADQPGSSLHILPLQSWYDGSLSFAPDLEKGFESWPWVDFARCSWPSDFPLGYDRIPQGLVDYFLESNRGALETVLQQQSLDDPSSSSKSSSHPLPAVMTVSHFLPNLQTLPDWKDLDAIEFDRSWLDHGAGEMSAKFAKVAGSAKIDEQIRSLRRPGRRRQLHVFGHSHRPKDLEWDGIRYVHNPLGKPRERELHMIDPDVDFQLLWDATTPHGEVSGERILRYWDERGGGKEALWERLEQNQSLRSRGGRYNNPPPKRR